MYAPTRLTVSGHLQHASSSRRTSYPSTCETPSSASTTRRGFRNLIGALPSHRLRRRRHPHTRHARLRNHNSGTDNNDVGEEVSTPTTTTAPAISGYVHKEISITDGTGMSHPLTTLACHTSTVPTTRSEKIHYTISEDPLHDPRRSRTIHTPTVPTTRSEKIHGGGRERTP